MKSLYETSMVDEAHKWMIKTLAVIPAIFCAGISRTKRTGLSQDSGMKQKTLQPE